MPRNTRGSAFNKGFDPTGMYDYKPSSMSNFGFDTQVGSLTGSKYSDFDIGQNIFSPKKKESNNFLKDFLKKNKKPDEDSTSAKIAEGIYKSYRPEEKSSQDKIADMLAARIGLGNQGGGFGGVSDVAQGLTLSGQGGGLREPIIIAGKEGSGGIGGGIQGAAGGYLSGGPVGAVIGGIGGLFCDVRVKEDIAPLCKSEVNDLLSECAFFVKDLNECS